MKKRILSAISVIMTGIVMTGVIIDHSEKVRSVKTFTAFFATTGVVIDSDNDIKQIIADKTGAQCEEIWLNGETAEEATYMYIANGVYRDFISADRNLYGAKALVRIDEYGDEYPNIYNYVRPDEWDGLRQDDGHVCWIPQFGV